MIDFAHTVSDLDDKPDVGYLLGLHNLIAILESIMVGAGCRSMMDQHSFYFEEGMTTTTKLIEAGPEMTEDEILAALLL